MKRNGPKCVEKHDCSSEKDIVKLFLFCRKRFPKLSRSELRTCFANGTIFVNDVRIRCGHIDECKRLSPGDLVTIDVNTTVEDQNKIKSTPLNVLHQQPGMVIIQKPSGIRKSEIEKACQQRLFDNATDVQFLYHLEKGLGGLIVVAESTTHLLHLRQLLADGKLLIHYTCVISGYVGDVGAIATIPTTHQGWRTMDLQVIRTAQCRKCGLISHVRIQIVFDSTELKTVSTGSTPTSYSDRMTMLRYPTARMKSIRRALQASGHIIVGDGGAIKSNKGLYASVASIQLLDRSKEIDTIDASSTHRTSECSVDDMAMAAVDGMAMTAPMQVPGWTAFEPILVTLDDPKKFATLMDKEQFLYDLAQSKQEALLHAWSMRQSTGSDSLRPPVVKGLVGTNEEQNQEQEAFALIKNEQIDNDKERDGNNDSCSDDDSDVNSAQGDLEGDEEADETNGMPSLQDMQRMLSEGMPVEYILGESTFCGLTFAVTRDVMIPKTSSELLVRRALVSLQGRDDGDDDDVTRQLDEQRGNNDIDDSNGDEGGEASGSGDGDINVLDIGTGSGCLLLSILHHYLYSDTGDGGGGDGGDDDHRCDGSSVLINVGTAIKGRVKRTIRGVGIDLSSTALAIARRNALATKLDRIASFRNMDFSDLDSLMVDSLMVDSLVVGVSNDPPSSSTVPSPVATVLPPVPAAAVLIESNDNSIDSRNKPTPPSPPPLPTTTRTTARIGRFDVVVCNPPYSSLREQRLSTTSREYEPSMALYATDNTGGASGPLGAYRTLANAFVAVEDKYQQSLIRNLEKSSSSSIPKLQHLFNTDARIILEVGSGQDLLVQQIFSKCNVFLQFLGSHKDHKGIVRCLEYKYVTSQTH